jgi:acetyltransferase-like isoleucine patch superfamily enzyme
MHPLEVDVLRTARYRISRRIDLNLTVYRNAHVHIRPTASITGLGSLRLGAKWPAYDADRTLLSVWDRGSITVCGKFTIYTGCSVVVDRDARLELGSGFINAHSSISCFKHISIGDDVAISENTVIRDSDNHSIVNSSHEQSQPIQIGDHVWIGLNTIILKGVTIGAGSVIAAGSLVNKSIPDHVLAGGIPAKVIRDGVEWK